MLFCYVCLCLCPALSASEPPQNNIKRRVVLLGPHDRYNFGDLLFEKVLQRLLTVTAGYNDDDIISAGMVDINMLEYGGTKNVVSMKRVIEMSQEEAITNRKGPYDIIFTGGESGGCNVVCGANMMMNTSLTNLAIANYVGIGECAYAVNKSLLLPRVWPPGETAIIPQPVAIKNSLGGVVRSACNVTVDYQSFRDVTGALSSPDCAVMIRFLFADLVEDFASRDEVLAIRETIGKYVAVQFKPSSTTAATWAMILDNVSRQTQLTPVLFRAGSAPGHDSLDPFFEIKRLMHTKCEIFQPEHVWKVVALISKADYVVSTSLHVRIMAFVYHKPRALLSPKKNSKHMKFMALWEAYPFNRTLKDDQLQAFVLNTLNADMKPTTSAVKSAIFNYLKTFHKWSELLNR